MSRATSRPRTTARRRTATLGLTISVLLGGAAACSQASGETVLNLYGGFADLGSPEVVKECNAEAKGRYTIVGNLLPSDADGQREQFVRRLAARDAGMDLLGMDVTWTAEFAEAGWIRELTGEKKAAATAGVLAPPVRTATWKDKLYGIPRTTNVQLLWYRKSLVPKPPKTLDEMIDQATKLKAAGKPHEIGFTGAQYEGYVVNVNNFLTATGATFVNEDSTEVTLGPKAVEGLKLLRTLATSGVTSASLSNAQEPEVFADLQAGRSAFSINWPYVLSAMTTAGESDPQSKKVAQDLGFTSFPTVKEGETPRVTLGGMNYAISTYSKHPEEAYEAAMCLRNEKHQLDMAIKSGNAPVLEKLYQEPELRKVYPMGDVMLAELKNAVPRPVTPIYQNISTITSTNLSPPQSMNPQRDERELRRLIQQAIDGKGILP